MAREEVTWLSTREAARQLGITPRTLYRLIDDGQVAAHKIGRVIRLKQSDVDDFVERSRITPGELEHLYLGGDDEADEAEVTDETEVVETD
jgi:excisionase family DNA binding protein